MRNRRMLSATLVAGALALGAAARAGEPAPAPPAPASSQQDLQAQVKQLQERVAELEMKQAKAADTDATVAAIIRDADRRSQLLAVEGFTAGYTADRGFVIQSTDGNYLLHPYIQTQLRNVTNYRDDVGGGVGHDSVNGFEVRRLKLGFDGNFISPDLTYAFQWATNRGNVTQTDTDSAGDSLTEITSAGGTPILEDAWVRYRFADMWAVRGGQFKDPFAHEQLVSSTRQLAADRSLLNNILEGNDDYIQGLSLIYDLDRLRAEVAYTDGFDTSNNGFQDGTYNFGVAGRVEYMVIGDPASGWKQYQAFSALNAKTDLLVLGAGGDWSESDTFNRYWYTVDAQWQPEAVRPLSVYGAYVGRYTAAFDGGNSAYDWGYLAQAGYLITSRWEPFVRFDYTKLADDFDPAAAIENDLYEATVGVNYYFKGHNAKFVADLTYLPNGVPAGINVTGLGILPQTTDDFQFVGRLQFQLVL